MVMVMVENNNDFKCKVNKKTLEDKYKVKIMLI